MSTTVAETNTKRMIGLSDSNTNIHFNSIIYALFLSDNGTLDVYENGDSKGSFGSYATGDVLSVQRTGSTITYLKNGSVLYTSTVASTGDLHVDTSLNTPGATLNDIVIIDTDFIASSANFEVQTLSAAAAKIEAYNNGDGTTPAALTVADYTAAGVTGVTATNLAAVNANVLAAATGGADTTAEVQTLVTAANSAVTKIEAYNNGDGTTPAALTVADYTAAGVTGVTATNLAAVNANVLAAATGGADTTAEVQTLVTCC